MQPQELYFHGSMAQFWIVIYAAYQRLYAALGREPFRLFSPLGSLGGRISEYAPKETDKILITFFDHGHGLDVISLEVEFSRIKEMVCLTITDSDSTDYVLYEGYGKSALSMWNEVRSALEKSGRLVDLHAHILDNRPHLLAKPEEPPKPEHRSNINAWFDWYHGMLEAGFHCTLAEIAEETHHNPAYIRRLHANYEKEREFGGANKRSNKK